VEIAEFLHETVSQSFSLPKGRARS